MENDNSSKCTRKARRLAARATRVCPKCVFSDVKHCATTRCVKAYADDSCLQSYGMIGKAYGQDYIICRDYDITDPRRYDFNVLSRSELADILSRTLEGFYNDYL